MNTEKYDMNLSRLKQAVMLTSAKLSKIEIA